MNEMQGTVSHALAHGLARLGRFYPLQLGQGRFVQWPAVAALTRTLPSTLVTVTRSGTRIVVSPQEYLGRRVFFFGQHEPANLRVLSRLLGPTGTLWDVGANYGLFSIELARSRPSARVLAVEPHPGLVRALEQSIGLNGLSNVMVVPQALSNAPGQVTLSVPTASLAEASIVTSFGQADSVRVEATTLDALLAIHGPPDVMKVDVEGAEALVFSGGMRLFREHAPRVLMEVNEARYKPLGKLESVRMLVDLGYEFVSAHGALNERCRLDAPLPRGHDVVAQKTRG